MNSEQLKVLDQTAQQLNIPKISIDETLIYTFTFIGIHHGVVEIIDVNNENVYHASFMLHIDDDYNVSLTMDCTNGNFINPYKKELVTYFDLYAHVFLQHLTRDLDFLRND